MQKGDVYQLMISGPGDVEKYLSEVDKCVQEYNAKFGKSHTSVVIPRYWKTDAYAQSGGEGQHLLNEQLVRSSDFAVAVFWNRFGTKTRQYDSGTEEEIEEMLKEGKQVFVYFVQETVNMNKVDLKQLKKVREFKRRYQNGMGLTFDVESTEDFKKKFGKHLESYLSTNASIQAKQVEKTNTIIITDSQGNKQKYFKIEQSRFSNGEFLEKKRKEIIRKIKLLKDSVLPSSTSAHIESDGYEFKKLKHDVIPNNNMFTSMLNAQTMVKVPEKWIETINLFSESNELKLGSEFWNLGDLKESTYKLPQYFSNEPQVSGETLEKERYKDLRQLYWDVEEYHEYMSYFKQLDDIYFTSLSLSNIGNTPDDDIDVTLKVPIEDFLILKEVPYPGMNIIQYLLDIQFITHAFSIKSSSKVSSFPQKDRQLFSSPNIPGVLPRSVDEVYPEKIDDYFEDLEALFDYEYFQENDFYVIKFRLEKLKHQTSVTFPTKLLFKKHPRFIKFYISSSKMESISQGEIAFT